MNTVDISKLNKLVEECDLVSATEKDNYLTLLWDFINFTTLTVIEEDIKDGKNIELVFKEDQTKMKLYDFIDSYITLGSVTSHYLTTLQYNQIQEALEKISKNKIEGNDEFNLGVDVAVNAMRAKLEELLKPVKGSVQTLDVKNNLIDIVSVITEVWNKQKAE